MGKAPGLTSTSEVKLNWMLLLFKVDNLILVPGATVVAHEKLLIHFLNIGCSYSFKINFQFNFSLSGALSVDF